MIHLFFFIWEYLDFPSFLSDNFASYTTDNSSYFQNMKTVPIPFGLHDFRWAICCHMNWFSTIGHASFLFGCPPECFWVFNYLKLNYDMSWNGFIWVYTVLGMTNFLNYRFVFLKLGNFWPLLFPPLFISSPETLMSAGSFYCPIGQWGSVIF